MIRVLFMIVAVVAAILALVLQQPSLFVASGLALAVSIGLVVQKAQRRIASHKQASASYGRSSSARSSTPSSSSSSASSSRSSPDDDAELNALGILEIKPRSREGQGTSGIARAKEDAAVEDVATVPGEQDEEVGPVRPRVEQAVPESNGIRSRGAPQSTLTIKERSQTVRASIDEESEDQYKDVLVPFLQAVRAALGAQTVCLLKQLDESLHYHIEGVVSLNAYARSGGDFTTKIPLIQTRDSKSAVGVHHVSKDDFTPGSLGYYREAIAVKQLAVAAVPRPKATSSFFLLADSMQDGHLDDQRQRTLLSHFARLLGAVLDRSGSAEMLDAYDYVRPRREIISEEIEQARTRESPLALALVHLNSAESVADLGEQEIKSAERVLSSELRRAARQARVERFGELTYGVFFYSDGPEVESWAVELQRDLDTTTGPIRGGVSIGIAVLQERHDADAFRQDATDALREAFETGQCTIVE